MPARTLAYRLLLVSPLLYLGAIVVRARVHLDPFVFTACTAKQQEAFKAYQPYFIEAAGYQNVDPRRMDPAKLRAVAQKWFDGHEQGILRPLTPAHTEDYSRDGVKQQIVRVRDCLMHRLGALGQKEIREGNVADGLKDLVLSIKLGEVMKYSDPYAVAHSGLMQRTLLMTLPIDSPALGPKERLWLGAQLDEIARLQQPLEPMARLVFRLHKDRNASPERDDVSPLEDLLRHPETAEQRSVTYLASLPKPSEASSEGQSIAIGLLRMAGASQNMLSEQIALRRAAVATSVALVLKNPERAHVAKASP